MTWQLGAFTILAVALAAGAAWYERTKPDARIVALVGTLAAFGALGRIAFAALPNVKPTTDIVLVSGYALGGAPGFTVGALAALSSNFFFGQGPWTPWQMAGWGVTGMIGAGLAIVTRRRIGRWPLAIVCMVVGFGFTALQDVGDWVAYSDHSLAQLGVYVGKGLGFDAVHAIGCLLFALALGPALNRSLTRFKTRLRVQWREPEPGGVPGDGPGSGGVAGAGPGSGGVGAGSGGVAGVGAAGVGLLVLVMIGGWLAGQPGFGTGGGTARANAAGTPAGYLISAQNSDGGVGPAPGQPSTELYAGWAALGLASAGENPLDVERDGHSLISYIESGVSSNTDPGSIERTILVARAAGLSSTSFAGRNLVAELQADIGRRGAVSDQTNLTSFAVLALRAAGVAPAQATMSWLVRQQDADGGFNYATAGGQSDVDDTGAALEALAGADVAGAARARERAVAYLRAQQDRDGGFPSMPGSGSNAQSTAFAVQGLIAVGVDPSSLHRGGRPSPVDYLRSLEGGDGQIDYSRGTSQTPTWVTGEALMALEGKALPLAPVARAASPAPVHRSSHATTAANPAPASHAAHPVRPRRHPLIRTIPPRPTAGPNFQRLAADAGVLTAVTLAFVSDS
jgi:energy-coupling factor transport system substrate-specific component